jgi:hypothetical protein
MAGWSAFWKNFDIFGALFPAPPDLPLTDEEAFERDRRWDEPPESGVTLTDDELEAFAYFGQIDSPYYLTAANTHAATLRGLLARAAREGRSPDRMTKAPENVTEPIQEEEQ